MTHSLCEALKRGRVHAGSTLRVTASNGEVQEGVFETCDDSGLELRIGEGRRRVAASMVATVRRKQTRAGQLALMGALVLGTGLSWFCSQCAGWPDAHQTTSREALEYALMGVVVGVVVGSVMGAIVGVMMKRWKLVYERV